jgi:hypothetical protein
VLEASPKFKPTYPNATTTAETVVVSGLPTTRWWVDLQPGDRRDMFVLADQCVAAWRSFLKV